MVEKMLKWLENGYIGERIRKPEKIKAKLNAGKLVPGIYLVTLSHNPSNLLEILPAAVLVQKSAYDICPMIVGMTKGKEDALTLVTELIQEVYEETGAFEVEEYLKSR